MGKKTTRQEKIQRAIAHEQEMLRSIREISHMPTKSNKPSQDRAAELTQMFAMGFTAEGGQQPNLSAIDFVCGS